MTWPPNIRVFFAIEFDQETETALQQIILAMKKNIKSGHVRWTRPENFHITLKFIPAINEQDLALLITNVLSVTKKITPPLILTAGNCVVFPHFYRPRVIALEVTPIPLLEPIANDLTALCDELQLVRRDNVAFRPHITLGRVKHPKETITQELVNHNLQTLQPVSVKHITLFQSKPKEDGSHYTVIQRFPLG